MDGLQFDAINNKSKDKERDDETLHDCDSVMYPEMVRNYEDNEPCNDGTKSRKNE